MKEKWLKLMKRHPLGTLGLGVVIIFALAGIYAPFLASSKPLVVDYDGTLYFPLFRYLFFPGFFTKPLDLFFNLLMFTLPVALLFYKRPKVLAFLFAFQMVAFCFLYFKGIQDPASSRDFSVERQKAIQHSLTSSSSSNLDWQQELSWMNPYARLNLVLRYVIGKKQHEAIKASSKAEKVPSVWSMEQERQTEKLKTINETLTRYAPSYLNALYNLELYAEIDPQAPIVKQLRLEVADYEKRDQELSNLKDKKAWVEQQASKVNWMIMPLIRPYHWEDDAGGEQALNQQVPWWEATRINRKDLTAALIFGIRISLVVGFLAVGLALLIGVPIGAFAGYYGGTFDIIVSRLREIWESMPTFFMLLLVIAMVQSKNIFIVIAVIGLFGWTGFSQYVRGEVFKQRHLAYVDACRSIGFSDPYIIFNQILPNAIPPLLTLLPFAIMGAISSEAGLSFLGLGEEGSCSWGVLMDEGRSVFPGEGYLLWPPAIMLTVLLVAIALVGDATRDELDPKLKL